MAFVSRGRSCYVPAGGCSTSGIVAELETARKFVPGQLCAYQANRAAGLFSGLRSNLRPLLVGTTGKYSASCTRNTRARAAAGVPGRRGSTKAGPASANTLSEEDISRLRDAFFGQSQLSRDGDLDFNVSYTLSDGPDDDDDDYAMATAAAPPKLGMRASPTSRGVAAAGLPRGLGGKAAGGEGGVRKGTATVAAASPHQLGANPSSTSSGEGPATVAARQAPQAVAGPGADASAQAAVLTDLAYGAAAEVAAPAALANAAAPAHADAAVPASEALSCAGGKVPRQEGGSQPPPAAQQQRKQPQKLQPLPQQSAIREQKHKKKLQKKKEAYWLQCRDRDVAAVKLTRVLSRSSTVDELKAHVQEHSAMFNCFHVSCCLNRLVKSKDVHVPSQQPTLQKLLIELEGLLMREMRREAMTSRELCNAMWVWAKMGHVPAPETWLGVREALFGTEEEEEAKAATAAEEAAARGVLAAMETAAAKNAEARQAAVEKEGEAAAGVAEAEAAKEAVAGREDEVVVRVGAARGAEASRAEDPAKAPGAAAAAAAAPAGIATDRAARAKARTAKAAALRGSGLVTGRRISDATPQGVANAAWAMAKLGCTDAFAWRRIAECSLVVLPDCTPFDLAALAYAFAEARQGRTHPTHIALMQAIAPAAVAKIANFIPQDLSNTLWAYAKMGMHQPELFAAASPAIRQTISGFSQGGVVQVLWAYATLRVHDARLLGAMAHRMAPNLHNLNTPNLTVLVWALAKLVVGGTAAGIHAANSSGGGGVWGGSGHGSGSGGAEAAGRAEVDAEEEERRAVMTTSRSAQSARVRAGYVDPLSKYFVTGGANATSAAVAAAAAAAIMGPGGAADVTGSTATAVQVETDAEAATAAASPAAACGLTAAAFTSSGARDVDVDTGVGDGSGNAAFANARRRVLGSASDMEPELEVCVEATDMGGLGPGGDGDGHGADFVSSAQVAVAAAAAAQMESEAAASGAAEAVMAQLPPQLLHAVAEAVMSRLGSLQTRHLSVLLWSMATLGYADMKFFNASASVLTPRLLTEVISPTSLSHIAWAYTAVRYYDRSLYQGLAVASMGLCAGLGATRPVDSALALANVLWALGSASHYDEELFRRASRVVMAGAEANPRQNANLLALLMLACAYVGHKDTELYGQVSVLLRRVGAKVLTSTSLANICWALAVVQHADTDLLRHMFAEVASRRSSSSTLSARGCTQLFHCCIWLQDIVPGGAEVVALLPPGVVEVGRTSWLELAKESSVSEFQSDVFTALECMGLSPAMELKTPDRLFSLDMSVHYSGMELAVECNGPQHYLRTHPRAISGSTRLRTLLLYARGIHQVPISYHEWASLGGDRQRQQQYLTRRMDQLVRRNRAVAAAAADQEKEEEEEGKEEEGEGEAGVVYDNKDGDLGRVKKPELAPESAERGAGARPAHKSRVVQPWDDVLLSVMANKGR